MKKIYAIITAFAILLLLPAFVSAAGRPVEMPDVKFKVNNRLVKLTDVPLGIDGSMLLPLRDVLVSLGVPDDNEHIKWDGKDKSVTVISDGDTIYLKLGSKTARINGADAALEAAPFTYERNGKVYIPVKFISNAAGKEVVWDGGTRTVLIRDRDKYAEMKSVLDKVDGAMKGIEKVRLQSKMKLNIAGKGANINLDVSLKEELDRKKGLLYSVTEVPLFGGNVSLYAFYRDNTAYIKKSTKGGWGKSLMTADAFEALLSEDVSLTSVNGLEVMAASLDRREGGVKGEYLLAGSLYPAKLAAKFGQNAGITNLSPESCILEVIIDGTTNLVKGIHAEFGGKAGPANSRSSVKAVLDVEYSDYNGAFEIKAPPDLPA